MAQTTNPLIAQGYDRLAKTIKELESMGISVSGNVTLQDRRFLCSEKAPVRPASPELVSVVENLMPQTMRPVNGIPSGNLCATCGGPMVKGARCDVCPECGSTASCG
jgi:hypothetical protein